MLRYSHILIVSLDLKSSRVTTIYISKFKQIQTSKKKKFSFQSRDAKFKKESIARLTVTDIKDRILNMN